MKVCHICLTAGPYTDGFGYHENLLPVYHKKLGLEVVRMIHAKKYIDGVGTVGEREIKNYVDKDGIYNVVIERSKPVNLLIHKLYRFKNIYENLERIKPDILFVHGIQFSNVFDIIRYKKNHPYVRLYADHHGDYFIMPLNTWKRCFVQYCIYGYYARSVAKYTNVFWGVTPWREKYLHEVYKIKPEKTGVLFMGADDDLIHFNEQPVLRKNLREKWGLCEDDFVVISGGKVDLKKNIHLLVEAVAECKYEKIKLVFFGDILEECKTILNNLISRYPDKIRFIGWLDAAECYDYFLMADLAVFPGNHSVLWEQALATGIPTVFKHWEGMEHVDVGGNCCFLSEDTLEEIKTTITRIYEDRLLYHTMKINSVQKAVPVFSSYECAKKSIGII